MCETLAGKSCPGETRRHKGAEERTACGKGVPGGNVQIVQTLKTAEFFNKTGLFLMFFHCNPYWIEEICDTPAELLVSRDTAAAYGKEAWQTVGGKGADF
ncbi:hypothetical protein J7E52_18455 [Bacillus sp. ISL-34]|uniref:hypothetical protein n=1 Tax=Bacillus sp. ISL-34 TaxID=2819121 RepID=UPI001BEB2C88|nr:hypothetical protein [Bacillus sp. ISL-34]MBT2648656.1 hypothetical protein [Bacillus sp. ISL-34]